MNYIKKITFVALAFAGISSVSAQHQNIINFSQLPTNAQNFIKTHFSEGNISLAWEETAYLSQKEYSVKLNDGTEIEFLANGDWEEVKTINGQVPLKIVPNTISSYIGKNFQNVSIKEIKRKRRGYEIELSNGLDLDFDKNGKFLRVDD